MTRPRPRFRPRRTPPPSNQAHHATMNWPRVASRVTNEVARSHPINFGEAVGIDIFLMPFLTEFYGKTVFFDWTLHGT